MAGLDLNRSQSLYFERAENKNETDRKARLMPKKFAFVAQEGKYLLRFVNFL